MTAVTTMLGQEEAYRKVTEILFADEGVDVIVAILLASPLIPTDAYRFLPEFSRKYPHKPIYVSFTGDRPSYDAARDYLENHSVPVFASVEDIFEILPLLCRCREFISAPFSG